MGNPKAFLTITRKEAGYRPLEERKYDFGEVEQTLNPEDRRLQASRCMDCGVPFCHWACPLGNRQPEWQDLVYKGKWKEAYYALEATNDFPEFTGRVCPALCEKSCVLSLTEQPVTIRENEASIAERAFNEGFITPLKNIVRKDKSVAVVGSGPAGLAAANQLNRMGYNVTVYEKENSYGGLLRYGIPNFKLHKNVIDRRIAVMQAEGIIFKNNMTIGSTISIDEVKKNHDAICLAIGAAKPRDLNVEGRQAYGVHFALELLKQQNQLLTGENVGNKPIISAKNKHVVVIGGGDTGSDCVGTAVRQGALSVTQIEIMPMPPKHLNPDTPWPLYPVVLKTTSSHKEGCERRWSIETKRMVTCDGKVCGVEIEEVQWKRDENGMMSFDRNGITQTIKADLVLLAMGFVHVEHSGLVTDLCLETDKRGNVKVTSYFETSSAGIFAAGDMQSGAGLVVRSIDSGRKAAQAIHSYLNNNR